jgi:hypothetical protein
MTVHTLCMSGCALLASALVIPKAPAGSVFSIEDPPVDFEVIDADDGSGEFFFDGIGDFGPFATFNDAVLGSFGEARSMAEFDISSLDLPPVELLVAATFEVRITEISVFGLGVDGEIPESLAVDGYVGDGVAQVSDFQIADGNLLDTAAIVDPQIGDVLSFDVLSHVVDVVDSGESFVGLTVRAETFGGLMLEEGAGYPRLTIETIEAPCPGDLNGDALVNVQDLLMLLAAWGTDEADLNDDGNTNVLDLLILLDAWGECV